MIKSRPKPNRFRPTVPEPVPPPHHPAGFALPLGFLFEIPPVWTAQVEPHKQFLRHPARPSGEPPPDDWLWRSESAQVVAMPTELALRELVDELEPSDVDGCVDFSLRYGFPFSEAAFVSDRREIAVALGEVRRL